jgi:hypothetical protein
MMCSDQNKSDKHDIHAQYSGLLLKSARIIGAIFIFVGLGLFIYTINAELAGKSTAELVDLSAAESGYIALQICFPMVFAFFGYCLVRVKISRG